MTGFVYFLRCGDFVKVGFSTKPKMRVQGLQTGSPYEMQMLAMLPGTEAQERVVHRILHHVHHRLEWFRYGPDVLSIISEGLPHSDMSTDMKANRDAMAEAIRIYGGASALSRRLKVSRNAVSEWGRTGNVPIDRANEIEALTGVAVRRLRSDFGYGDAA